MTRQCLQVWLCVLVCFGMCTTPSAIGQQDGPRQSRVVLLYKRTEQQRKAVDQALAELQDPHSASYHKWLTPAEFGERFGATDAQIDRIRTALTARGLALTKVHPNRLTLEVSGTPDQLQQTFTSSSVQPNGMVRVNRKIPQDLSDVIETVVIGGKRQATVAPKKVTYENKRHTFAPYSAGAQTNDATVQPLIVLVPNYGVTPGDIAIQYSLPGYVQGSGTTITGAGSVIGIVSDYNINLAYPANYGSTFGITMPKTKVIVDGSDPGVSQDSITTYLEVEAIGAVAPATAINVYTAASDGTGPGVDLAFLRAITDNAINVLLYPFQGCEAYLGPTSTYNGFYLDSEEAFLDELFEEAAAQGITVITPSGDVGSAACDEEFSDAASFGLAVNGMASTPYATAVGGTDFYYGTQGTATSSTYETYWSNSTNSFTQQLAYVPEQAWNDSNVATDQNTSYGSYLLATGGGVSTLGLVNDDGSDPQPYPQPWWQLGTVPSSISQTARTVPDVSFFAGDAANYSYYVFCADGTDCAGSSQTAQNLVFTQGSGTEVSAAVFGGMMALVVGQHGPQGNVNPTLYSMAKTTDGVFNDVIYGTNSVACTAGSPNCSNGFLVDQNQNPAYAAGVGYDAATGLGSVNATALVQQWTPPNTAPSATTVAVLNSSTNQPITTFEHGTNVTLVMSVSGAAGTPTGDVAIITDAPQNASKAQGEFTLSGGSVTVPDDPFLPGGTYHLYARYAGDQTYQSSLSAATTLTVSPSPCVIDVFTQSIQSGATIPYGTPVSITMEPFDANNNQDVSNATGSLTVKDNGAALASIPLNSTGDAIFTSASFLPGSHQLTFSYGGDASFGSCSLASPLAFTVTSAPTTTTVTSTISTIPSQTKGYYALTAVVTASASSNQGFLPVGTVTFKKTNGTVLASAVYTSGFYSGATPAAVSTAYLSANALAVGNNAIVATFTPTSSTGYAASTSNAINVTVGSTTGLTNAHLTVGTADGGNVYYDTMSPVTINASVTGAGTPTGTVALFANGTFVDYMTALGNAHWTYSFTNSTTPTGLLALPPGAVTLLAQYSGDAANSTDRQDVQLTILDDQLHPDFSISATADYKTVNPGTTSVGFAIQLTPLNGFSGMVVITATAPPGASCSMPSPGTLSLGSKQFVPTTVTCTNLPTTAGRYPFDVRGTASTSSTTPNITTQVVHDQPLQVIVN